MRPGTLYRIILGRTEPVPIELSTPVIHRAIMRAIDDAAPKGLSGDYLDVGSGVGKLLKLIGARYGVNCFACDYTRELIRFPDQPVDIVDLNREPMPYADDRFSLATCAETIEHLERYRETIREIYRVLKPGGIAVITTPNILNLRSRLHNLTFGFASLFGPLAIDEQDVHCSRGHINPVGWFYLAHAVLDAGFVDLKLSIDKYQRRSLISLFFLYLPIHLTAWYAYRRELKHFRTINAQNDWIVRKINSIEVLLGRTLIVTARKPA
jgi:2-polyprenyl-3-methyl-5-hydroxy-6-metoxy-1,4-benzoquinol methylase